MPSYAVYLIIALAALLTFLIVFGWLSRVDRLPVRYRKYLLLCETLLLVGMVIFLAGGLGLRSPKLLLMYAVVFLIHFLKIYWRRGYYFGSKKAHDPVVLPLRSP